MNNNEIARIIGISKSTVSRIKNGQKNFSKYKIERVLFYSKFEAHIDELFKESLFRKICELVIKKATRTDARNYAELKRFAVQCLRWSDALINKNDLSKIDRMNLASLNIEPYKLFLMPEFCDVMNVAVCRAKDSTIIDRASVLYNVSNNIRKGVRYEMPRV